ncbi:MAG: hypothetical protein Barrevirus26_5 [Barrevirus sp.]|uniref:HTTM domain-containing protein n=1 Tax=Barrevirus sp. TaxID=2487763 RepID=A0A3G4ZQU6_9VIRU|nr:MAG: hypothetical protein Barrevirus26_5 [Barrevirus sp.]
MFMQFRFIFGLYLTWHFLSLISYADELFGDKMPFDPKLGPTYHIFPNILNHVDAQSFLVFLSVVSISFTFGVYHQICSIILWYGWASLLNRNVLIYNPGIPYVGWLLIAMSVIPNNDDSKMSIAIYWVAWLLMGLGYTISGIHKLNCVSWINGSALRHILNSPLARDNFLRNFLLDAPEIVLRMATWSSLALEILFLPLGMFYHIRFYFWLAFIGFHLGVITLINFTDLTIGVLTIHIFTFDPRWLPKGFVKGFTKTMKID